MTEFVVDFNSFKKGKKGIKKGNNIDTYQNYINIH